MSIQDAYTNWSLTYDEDRNRTRDLDRQVTYSTLSGQHIGTIVETGCGTGKNTAFLAEIGGKVTALDFSAGMLARAREKVQAANVTFVETDLTQAWPVEDRSADLVVCNLVLEHIENLHFIFAQAARVLLPGGRFFVCELHPFRQYQGTQATFQRGDGAVLIDAYVHHISDFLAAAEASGLSLANLKEWWHVEDEGKPPRLASFVFVKPILS
ncbi:MAG: class I SAM-dependent methyltransferase [Caldilineaceae bacterium]